MVRGLFEKQLPAETQDQGADHDEEQRADEVVSFPQRDPGAGHGADDLAGGHGQRVMVKDATGRGEEHYGVFQNSSKGRTRTYFMGLLLVASRYFQFIFYACRIMGIDKCLQAYSGIYRQRQDRNRVRFCALCGNCAGAEIWA